jgi:uncharacterized metal-binding protein
MEEAGIEIDRHILLSEQLDIKKNKDLDLDPQQVQDVLAKVSELL